MLRDFEVGGAFFGGIVFGWTIMLSWAAILGSDIPTSKNVCDELKHYHPEVKLVTCEKAYGK
jgi:hypothetical protein